MQALKRKFALSTDEGQSYKGVLGTVALGVYSMPEGPYKSALWGAILLAYSFISWVTVGSGSNKVKEAEAAAAEPTEDLDLEELVRQSRKP